MHLLHSAVDRWFALQVETRFGAFFVGLIVVRLMLHALGF